MNRPRAILWQAVAACLLVALTVAPGLCEPVIVGKGAVPSWSPDGMSLAWWYGRSIMVLKPGAESATKVVEGGCGRCARIAWLPDGSGLLAMMSTTATWAPVTDPAILEMVAKRMAEIGAINISKPVSMRPGPAVLSRVDLATSQYRQWPSLPGRSVSDFAVDPSGRYVVLSADKVGTPFTYRNVHGLGETMLPFDDPYDGLWLVDLAQNTSALLMPSEKAMEVDPRLSPDGRRVLFTRYTNISDIELDDPFSTEPPRRDVAVLDLGTGVARTLTSTGHATGESWSPDGRWVVYMRGSELWLAAPDGTRRRQLETGKRGCPDLLMPVLWAGSSTVVFLDELSKGICAVGIDGRGPYPLTPAPLDLETRHGFSLNPDNQRLAYTDTHGNVCVVALDWSQVPPELRP